MEILTPPSKGDKVYFTLLVRRHEPGGTTTNKQVTLRPKTPQQEAMSAADLLGSMLAFMAENRW